MFCVRQPRHASVEVRTTFVFVRFRPLRHGHLLLVFENGSNFLLRSGHVGR